MAHRFNAHIIWTGASQGATTRYDGYSREFLIEIDGKPPLRGSSAPVYLGDPGLHNPEDLLVASLSTCHMLWYLHLCANAGVAVAAYVDDAEGVLDQVDGKMAFTEVVLRPQVSLLEGDEGKALALHDDAHRECFIANSVNFPVRCEPAVEEMGAT
jgi:organic hydroperoxide reductase OsmC/OhrA